MFYLAIEEILLYLKTRIKVFFLDLNVKARMSSVVRYVIRQWRCNFNHSFGAIVISFVLLLLIILLLLPIANVFGSIFQHQSTSIAGGTRRAWGVHFYSKDNEKKRFTGRGYIRKSNHWLGSFWKNKKLFPVEFKKIASPSSPPNQRRAESENNGYSKCRASWWWNNRSWPQSSSSQTLPSSKRISTINTSATH